LTFSQLNSPIHRLLKDKKYQRLCLLLMSIWLALLVSQPARLALAQDGAYCQQVTTYLDLDGDGIGEAMQLACQFSPTSQDALTIYKDQGKIDVAVPWWQNITYQNETWVFDNGTQGRASLIIHFTKEGTSLVAELYDDRNQDGEVSYEVKNGRVQVTESQYWTVKVTAPDGWWLKDRKLNENLHIQVDGDVEAMFMMEPYRSRLVTDGQPDYDIQVTDLDQDGRPEFDKRMELTPFLKGSVGLGTQMMANWADNELPISGGFDLWPYIDLAHTWESGSRIIKGSHASSPPIMFEPATGRIEAVGEFVASRGNEHNCFYYSANPWFAGQLNQSDFESPFCFYDLASDGDGIPELQVRSVYWPPNDGAFLSGSYDGPYQLIRYSWDQENSATWRYAIGLVGRHPQDSVVSFADEQVLTVPYEQFPSWVNSNSWDMAVFSEFTGKQYWTSEGNYSVSYLEDTKFAEYFTGMSDVIPSPEYEPDVNFKMEWAMDYSSRPYLYLSPLDHHLHLLGASGGVWNLGDNSKIRYQNLDGDAYLDQWQYWTGDTLLQQMNQAKGSIVVSGMYQVKIKLTDTPSSLFETQPPGSHDEWLKLGEQLEANQSDLVGNDFSGMLEQLPGEMLSIGSATLRDYRPTETGYRFVLGLEPGFTFEGPDWLGLAKLEPGEYAVIYEDGKFKVMPLTPAQVTVGVEMNASETLTQYGIEEVGVSLTNQGLEDAKQVLVRLGTYHAGGEISYTEPQTVTVNAGESTLVSFDWSPKEAGQWQLQAQASMVNPQSNSGQSVSAVQQVLVQPAEGSSLQDEVSGFGVVAPWQVVLLIGSVVLTAGLSGWALVRSVGQREMNAVQDPSKVDRNKA
jgi:hypothetical protein